MTDRPAVPAVNPLLARTDAPPIPEARAWTRRYGGGFGPLVDLSQAAPGTAPPDALLAKLGEAAATAAAARYGDIAGDAALREAIARETARRYGGTIGADDVAITAGCNQAFFVAALTVAKAGDAILVPTPWYFNHQTTLEILGIEPRPLPCPAATGFIPDVEAAARLCDARVKAIALVTPNNPTGAIYPQEVIARFAELCRARGIWLILDETYCDFLPAAEQRPHALFGDPAWRDTVIRLYSFSKAYAVPGHRVGAMIADGRVVAEIAKVLDNLQICAPRAAQIALAWGVDALGAWREQGRAEIVERGAAFRRMLNQVPGWRVDSAGAYFAYVRHPFAGEKAQRVAERLATERGVLCLPGSFFGPDQEAHLRIAIANVARDTIAGLAPRFAF
ncbi:MAG: aminotransferase [Alphaproteobacteria bacterium]|nr:aminotransferase [Alphaproteobacteria bacterium]